MAPHPLKEVDQERKEELMIAKQLRQSRVTILPRTLKSPNFLNMSPYSSKSTSPSPNSFKKKSYMDESLPSNWSLGQKDTWEYKYQGPSKKYTDAASNPIALRYWNQCLSKVAHTEIAIPEITTQAPEVDTSWEDCPPWAVSHSHLLSPNEGNVEKESLIEKKCNIKVPDIKRHMNRLDNDRLPGTKPWSGNSEKQVNEMDSGSLLNNKSWMGTTGTTLNPDKKPFNSKASTQIEIHNWSDSLVQKLDNMSETIYELPTFERSVAHDDPSPLVERKHSINKSKIKRNNEIKEAAQNIGRFITIDQIDRNDKHKISTTASGNKGSIESKHEEQSHHKSNDLHYNKSENVAPPLPPKNSKQLSSSHEKVEVFETPPDTRQNSPGEEYQKQSMSQSYVEMEKQLKVNIPQESFIHIKPAKQKSDIYDKEESIETKRRLSKITKTFGKDDIQIQLDATSDMSTIADMLIPQLNSMQKNHLGLVLFNQLSNNIVEDVLIQQLTVMSGAKLYNALKNVDKKILEHVVPKLIPLLSQEMIAGVVTVLMNTLKVEEKAEVEEEDVSEFCTKLMGVIEKKKKHKLIKAAIKDEDDDDLIEELFKDYLKRKSINELNEEQIQSQDDIDENNEVIEAKNIPTINIVDDEDNGNTDDTADNVTEIDSEEVKDLQDMNYNKDTVKEELEKSDEESWEWEEEYDEEESYSVETFNGEFSVALVN